MAVTLAQFRALVYVADHGGFAAAADELGVTQSAVSHAVSALEDELECTLVTRRPDVVPTAVGVDVLAHARAALASAEALVVAARQRSQHHVGTIRLAAPSTVCFGLLPRLLTQWQRALPAITVRVFEGDDAELLAWLEDGTVDAAIAVNPESLHSDAVVLARDAYCAVLREDHPLAESGAVAVADLLDDPILVSAGGCGPQITALFQGLDRQFAPTQRVYDNAALLSFVASGLGVTIFPSIGAGMLPPGTLMVPLEPAIERTLVFSGPIARPWHPLVWPLLSSLDAPASPVAVA